MAFVPISVALGAPERLCSPRARFMAIDPARVARVVPNRAWSDYIFKSEPRYSFRMSRNSFRLSQTPTQRNWTARTATSTVSINNSQFVYSMSPTLL